MDRYCQTHAVTMLTLNDVLSSQDIFGLDCLRHIVELTEMQKDVERQEAIFVFHIQQSYTYLVESIYANNCNKFLSSLKIQHDRNKCTFV